MVKQAFSNEPEFYEEVFDVSDFPLLISKLIPRVIYWRSKYFQLSTSDHVLEKPKECVHCWHYMQKSNPFYPFSPTYYRVCCFCGVEEILEEKHGPYKPNEYVLKTYF